MTAPEASKPDTIVLIHGLWMTALSWEHWVERYEGRGFTVVNRSWPGMDGDIDALRSDTSAIDNLGVGEIVDHYVVNLTKSLAQEFGPSGVRVNAISPGPVATDLWLGEDGARPSARAQARRRQRTRARGAASSRRR